MEELIPWLSNIEHLACKFYKQCSHHFEDDEIFSGFLKSLSEDEAHHYNIMQRASSYVSKIQCNSFIKVDQELSNETESTLLENLEKIRGNNLEKDDLLDTIAIIEFSEWNDLFLYVIRVLATKVDEFQYISAKFETHRQAITYYFESIPEGKKIIEAVTSLNSIWNEHILIVEDSPDIATLLTAVFRRYGNIDHAKNGAEALEMLKKRYYKLIISDMEMPVMNGKVFFLAARDMYPNLQRKFLFHTGNQQTNHLQFFKENNIQYIYKPARLSSLRKKALRILHNSNYSEKERYKIEQTLKKKSLTSSTQPTPGI